MCLNHYKNISALPVIEISILFALLGTVLVFNPITLSAQTAQTGSFNGMVIDSTTSKPFEGVQVELGDIAKATTSEQGIFKFHDVPVGEYTLSVNLMGYTTFYTEILVDPVDQQIPVIKLVDEFLDGDRVFVVNRKRAQVESLTRQRKSKNLSTVLSKPQIDGFGDYTVSNAIARMAGVHIGQQGKVNIRGTGYDQAPIVMLDGQRIASTGFGNRRVDLAGFSTDMIHQLEFIKVITPDLEADAIGGVVNIRTQQPSGQRDVVAFGGTGAQPNYFGYTGTGFRTGINYSEALQDNLSFSAGLSFQQDYLGWESLNLEHAAVDFGEGYADVIQRVSPGLHANQQRRLAGKAQLNYRPTDHTVIYIRGFYNNDDRTLDRHRNYWDTGDDWLEINITGAQGGQGIYGYNANRQDYKVHQYTMQTGAQHWFDHFDLEYNLNWSSSNTQQDQFSNMFMREGLDFSIDTQDRIRPKMQIISDNVVLKRDGTIDYRTLRLQDIERTSEDYSNNIYSGNVNLNIPFGSALLKFGSSATLNYNQGSFRQTAFAFNRTLNLNRFWMIPRGEISIFGEEDYLIPWLIDTQRSRSFLEENTPFFSKKEIQERKNSDIWNYDHTESIFSGYGMGTVHLGNFEVLGGVRVEHTLANYSGHYLEFNGQGEYVDSGSRKRERQYTHIFPNAQLAYVPSDNANIRLAYSRSIGRPNFNRLSPFSLTIGQDSTIFRGNPNLEPMISDNLDLMLDHYFQSVGHVGIGVFYKNMSNYVIERTNTLTEGEFMGFNERIFENGQEESTLYGVELSWQQNLTFLPGMFGNFGTYVNYTWSKSVLDTDYRQDEDIRLPGHSPHIVNSALIYSQGRIYSQLSYKWTAETLLSISESKVWAPSINRSEQVHLDLYEGGWGDLSLSFGFHISENFRFWADAYNLLRNERIIYANSRSVYPLQTNLSEGVVFRTGVRFDL